MTSDERLIETMIEDAQIDRTHSVHVAMMREHVEKIKAEARRAALEEAARAVYHVTSTLHDSRVLTLAMKRVLDLREKGGEGDG